jgi:hypothetical protein
VLCVGERVAGWVRPLAGAPLYLHAPTYWARRRREAWLPGMLSDPRAVVPRFSGERAEWATDGQEAGQPPSLMLITELPRVPARILSGFSFSWKTPCGGAGTLAAAPAWRQRAEIYIFLGWPLPLAEGASFVGTRRSALPRLAHLLQPRKEPRPEDRESAADSSTAANAGPRVHAACDTPLPGVSPCQPAEAASRSLALHSCLGCNHQSP